MDCVIAVVGRAWAFLARITVIDEIVKQWFSLNLWVAIFLVRVGGVPNDPFSGVA